MAEFGSRNVGFFGGESSGGGGGGTVTSIATTSPLTGGTITTSGTLGITQSSASDDGYLGSTDWSRFANFQILSGYQLLGSSFKSILMSNPSISNITQSLTLATGQLRLIAVYVPIATTVQGVKWFQSQQGAFTSSGFNGVALFSYSGGTLSRISISADSELIWETATLNTWGSTTFTSPQAISSGLYYIGILFNGGATVPAIYGTVNSASANVNIGDFTNSAKLNLNLGSQTTMPTSVSMSGAGVTVSVNNPAFYLF